MNIVFLVDLAVDWVNDKIYFVDDDYHLGVLDPVNFYHQVLIDTSELPRSIVLDPLSR